MRTIIALMMSLTLLFSGCSFGHQEDDPTDITEQVTHDLVSTVAALPALDLSSIESFQQFQEFAEYVNILIKILNEKAEGIFDIPSLEVSNESYKKASRVITEYGPLINNYNEVIDTAKLVENGDNEPTEFYLAAGKFGFELALINWGVFYGASYKSVGIVYRAVGLNKLAPHCGSCISVILQSAHWTMRNFLVEETSELVEPVIDSIGQFYESDTYKSIEDAIDSFTDKVSND